MKMQENAVKIVRTDEFKESNFGIRSNKDLVHIFNVLRSKMYSNKILAVLREYSTNAADAHILAGTPDKPFKVKLPTNYEPHLEIRDFGPGLTEEEVREIYCMYGASTKRESNDFNGQLGFGSKSGFAYGDSFQITSFKDGEMICYEAYLDESQLGAITELMRTKTTEPDGIKITIPVKNQDIPTFKSTAEQLYKYFRIIPEVQNGTVTKPDYEMKGTCWGILKSKMGYSNSYNSNYGYNSSYGTNPAELHSGSMWRGIMGNVVYPIDVNLIRPHVKSTNANELLILMNLPLDISFDIGDVSIAASREGLEYDKKTIASVIMKMNIIIDELGKELNKKIKDCKDIIEAKVAWRTLNTGSYGNVFRQIAGTKGVEWNGIKITNDHFRIDEQFFKDDKIKIDTFQAYSCQTINARPNEVNYTQNLYIGATNSQNHNRTAHFIVDTDDKPVARRKNAHEAKYNGGQQVSYTYFWKFPNDAAKKEVLDSLYLEEKHFNKLSDVDPWSPPPAAVAKKKVINKKHQTKAFTLEPASAKGKTWSDQWKATTLTDSAQDVYVALDRFHVKIEDYSGVTLNPNEFREMLVVLDKVLGSTWSTDCVGIKESAVDKLGKNWKTLKATIQQDLLDTLKDTDLVVAWWVHENNSHYYGKVTVPFCPHNKTSELQSTNSTAVKLWKELDKAKDVLDDKLGEGRISWLKRLFDVFNAHEDFDKALEKVTEDMKQLVDNYAKDYPLAAKMEEGDVEDAHIIQYINSVDFYNEHSKNKVEVDNE